MDSPARSWREFPQRYRLEAAKCTVCDKVLYPPRVVCPKCGASTFEDITLPREGTVVTYTIVRVPPAGFTEQTPLPIALVELMEGVRVMVGGAALSPEMANKIGADGYGESAVEGVAVMNRIILSSSLSVKDKEPVPVGGETTQFFTVK